MVECDGVLTASDNASKLNLQSVYYTYNHSENIYQQQQKREPSLWITGNINMVRYCTNDLRAFTKLLHAMKITLCSFTYHYYTILISF